MSFSAGIIKSYLYKQKVDIEDRETNSKYFNIIDLKEVYTKNIHYFGIRGSLLLKPNSEIYGEILDQQGSIIPLYLVNEPYSLIKGVSTLGFEVLSSTVQGDAILCIIGTTRNNKQVRWSKRITIVNEDTQNEEEFGGFIDLPYSIPVEVSGSHCIVDSGSVTDPLSQSWQVTGTGSYFNAKLRFLNHQTYIAPYITTQSQGSASDYFQSYPTTSKLNSHQLRNIDKYHVFVFESKIDGNTQSSPPYDPNFYPTNLSQSRGVWYWIDSINVAQGTASGVAPYIEYTVNLLSPGKQYYFYIAMTTSQTLNRWYPNIWNNINKGTPRE